MGIHRGSKNANSAMRFFVLWTTVLVGVRCTGEGPVVRPIADIQAPTWVALGESAVLSAGASTDPLGRPLSYHWNLLSMPEGSEALLEELDEERASLLPDAAGTYAIELVARTGDIESEPVSASVRAGASACEDANEPPEAEVTEADLSVSLGATAILDGSPSFDEDHCPSELTYSWYVSSAPLGAAEPEIVNLTSATASFIPSSPGEYSIVLAVSDGELEDEVVVQVHVEAEERCVTFGGDDWSGVEAPLAVSEGSIVLERREPSFCDELSDPAEPDLIVDGQDATASSNGVLHDSSNPRILSGGSHCYRTVIVQNDGWLSVEPWSIDITERMGGTLRLRAFESITVDSQGAVDVSGDGYCGGLGGGHSAPGYQGRTSGGLSEQSVMPGCGSLDVDGVSSCCGGGGGGDKAEGIVGDGGGGGYGTAGHIGVAEGSGEGGRPYGDAELSVLHLGSGGGGGSGCYWGGGPGGAGGGALVLEAPEVTITDEGQVFVEGANGTDGCAEGGGGSGGSIHLRAIRLVVNGQISAAGGLGWAALGGNGGHGRIRFDADVLDTERSIIAPDVGFTQIGGVRSSADTARYRSGPIRMDGPSEASRWSRLTYSADVASPQTLTVWVAVAESLESLDEADFIDAIAPDGIFDSPLGESWAEVHFIFHDPDVAPATPLVLHGFELCYIR